MFYLLIVTISITPLLYFTFVCLFILTGFANLPPVFTQDMNNLALSESTPVDTVIYTLEGYDPEGEDVTFGLIGSDNFDVNPKTGEVKIVKALDREVFVKTYFLHYKHHTFHKFKQT